MAEDVADLVRDDLADIILGDAEDLRVIQLVDGEDGLQAVGKLLGKSDRIAFAETG